jgi:hypothetical protein
MDVQLPDGTTVQGVPDGTTKEQLLSKLVKVGHPAAAALARQMGTASTLDEMGGLGKFNAGMGSAFQNIVDATKQMLGMNTEYGQNKEAQSALLHTKAGLGGNIAGNIAAFAPVSVIPGANTVAGAGAIGATVGAFQPTDTSGERLKNMAMGGALGGGTQAIASHPVEIMDAAKGVGRGLKATVEPFTEEGRNQILARTLRQATGGDPAALANLRNAKTLVPGSEPTAAEVAGSPGLAGLQRTASAIDPQSFGTREIQQHEARVAALQDLAGTKGARDFAAANRDATANQLYQQAYDVGVDLTKMSPARRGEITKLMQRPAVQDAMSEAKRLAANEGVKLDNPAGSVKGLDYLKRALDDQIENATGNEQRILVGVKNRLLTTIDTLSPEYAAARKVYQDMSKPINQMDIAQEIADKSINKLTDRVKAQALANALTDDTAKSATGFGKATLENTLEPDQLARLTALKEDAARSVFARDAGRNAGSDTVQKLSMSNMMRRSGLPETAMHIPGVSRPLNWAYSSADERMRQQLAQALLNPQEAGVLLSKAGSPALPGVTNPQIGSRNAALARALLMPAIAEGSRQ